MKTSNKLLLTGLLALITSSLISMVIAKSNMTITHKVQKDGGEIITHIISENLSSNKLILRDYCEYILDPNSTAFKVEIGSNYIDNYSFVDDSIAEIRSKNSNQDDVSNEITVYMGVKGKTKLEIIVNDHCTLSTKSEINLRSLTMKADDNTNIRLSLDVDTLSLDLSDYTKLYLEGRSNELDIRAEDHVSLQGKNLNCDNLIVKLEDDVRIYLNSAKSISGTLENESKVYTDKAWIDSNFKLYNQAGVFNSDE